MERRRRSIFEIINELFREVEERFEEVFEEFERPLWDPVKRELTPLTEVRDEYDEVVVTADLPYVRSLDDVEVSIEGRVVTIRAKLSRPVRHEGWAYGSCDYDTWFKRLTLPYEVEPSGFSIRFKNGILELRLKKKRGRLIRIE